MQNYLKKYSSLKIDSSDLSLLKFNPEGYSRFKYGSKKWADKFGYFLALRFFNDFLSKELDRSNLKNLLVISAPYHYIPTATYALKTSFMSSLNNYMLKNGYGQAYESKIDRIPSYITEYGSLSAKERKDRLTGDSFKINRDLIKDHYLILLDDIRVTGAHEERIINMFDRMSVQAHGCLVYFSEVINNSINPNIEDQLNHYSVKTLWDIDDIYLKDGFVHNTRSTKFILKSDHEEFKLFMKTKPENFKKTLIKNLIGNNYHQADDFKVNVNYLLNQN